MADEPEPEQIGAWDRDQNHDFAWENEDRGLFVFVDRRKKDPDSGVFDWGETPTREEESGWQVLYRTNKPSNSAPLSGEPCGDLFYEKSDAKELAVEFMDAYRPISNDNPLEVAQEEVCK